MQRFARLSIVLLVCAPLSLAALQEISEQPPLYRGPVTEVQGVFVTPVAGVPFTATVAIRSEHPAADGTMDSRHTVTQIARDSSGRIRNERHMLVPDSFHGTPPLIAVHIFDPATRLSNIYNPATMISRQMKLPPPAQTARSDSTPGTENLGTTTLNGLEAKETRVTRTIPAQFSGTGKPVQVIDEIWYSEDLNMNLLERHTDPRGGVQTVAITSFQREEPPPSLFEVPGGYKIVDMTPPEKPAGPN
jgi:hypothetical protein